MEEQKIKQDIRIGANIRRIRKNRASSHWHWSACSSWRRGNHRESLVKIERGLSISRCSQLRGIRDALHTTYDELLAEAEKR